MQMESLAKAAGLQRAWAEHRGDVEEAIAAATRLRQAAGDPPDPRAEPLPPYRAPLPAPEPRR